MTKKIILPAIYVIIVFGCMGAFWNYDKELAFWFAFVLALGLGVLFSRSDEQKEKSKKL